MRTKAREDDLHIALGWSAWSRLHIVVGYLTVESQSYELEGCVPQANIKTRSCATGSYPGEIEHCGHYGLLSVRLGPRRQLRLILW